MLVLGLTGSIATGKSTCSKHLAAHSGVAVVDADEIAHDLMVPGGTTYYSILSAFMDSAEGAKSLDAILAEETTEKVQTAKSCPLCPTTGSGCPITKVGEIYTKYAEKYVPAAAKNAAASVPRALCPHTFLKHLPKECCPKNQRAIDRKALGEIIFNNKESKAKLNAATHPYIRVVMLRKLLGAFLARNAICFYDTPLLFEVGLDRYMLNGTVVVYAPKKTQIERLIKRDNITKEQAVARVDSQMDIEDKKKRATFIIDNSSNDVKTTHKQIDDLIGGEISKKLSPVSKQLFALNHLVYLLFVIPVFFVYAGILAFEYSQACFTRTVFFFKVHNFCKYTSKLCPTAICGSLCKKSDKTTVTKAKETVVAAAESASEAVDDAVSAAATEVKKRHHHHSKKHSEKHA